MKRKAALTTTVVSGILLFSSAALYNGFPLLWPDSGSYLLPANAGFRTPFYGFLIWAFHWRWSLWPVVLTQSAVLFFVLRIVTRVVFPQLTVWAFLFTILCLQILSSAPWVTGLIMPDLFAPVLGMSVFLLILHFRDLRHRERNFLAFLLFLSVLVHLSHLPLAVCSIGLALLIKALHPEKERTVGWSELRWLATPLALAVALLMGNTYLVHGKVGL